MSPKKHFTPSHFLVKRAVGAPAAPQRFPCPSRGTNCPIHLCRWRCQLPGNKGRCLTANAPFQVTKKKTKGKQKKWSSSKPFPTMHFSGATKSSNFSGGIPGFFQHIQSSGHPKVKVPQNDIPTGLPTRSPFQGTWTHCSAWHWSGCLKSLFKPRFDELRKTHVIINLGKSLKTICFCHK